jgi:hypothetical protein
MPAAARNATGIPWNPGQRPDREPTDWVMYCLTAGPNVTSPVEPEWSISTLSLSTAVPMDSTLCTEHPTLARAVDGVPADRGMSVVGTVDPWLMSMQPICVLRLPASVLSPR